MPEAAVKKAGWTQVAFADVVRLGKERSRDPEADAFERYVGLEHLDPGDFKIRRWGNVADGTTFTNVFRPRQVLFGKRRAYQRKVAVAGFSGVCSGDIYVFESKDPDVLLPELLSFICRTDAFFEHAIGTSAGSLSPRTNWKSLAKYEFALPPLEEQRRIAEVLTTAEAARSALFEAAESLERLADSVLASRLTGLELGEVIPDSRFGRHSRKLGLVPLGRLVPVMQYGLSEAAVENGRYPMLRMMDLRDGLAIDEDLCRVDLSVDEFERYRLRGGDVLFNRTNSHDLVGRTGVYKLSGEHVFASYLIRLRTAKRKLIPEYLCMFLNHSVGRRQVLRFATRGVSQSNVNAYSLRRILIPLPPLSYQEETVQLVSAIRTTRERLAARASQVRRLGSLITDQFLGASE